MNLRKNGWIIGIFLFTILINASLSQAQTQVKRANQVLDEEIDHYGIINQGLQIACKKNLLMKYYSNIYLDLLLLKELEKYYNYHPEIEFASLIKTTMTIKFIDGSYKVITDIFSTLDDSYFISKKETPGFTNICTNYVSDDSLGQTALILNPSEYLYGNRYCRRIINRLINKGYNIVYLENEDVNLTYVKYHLGTEIVYMNTHAGYWDIDGDHQSDAVVIATGEYWTNETEHIYQFEYENQMIVEGMVGKKRFVAFAPSFIEYYYNPGDFPDSMIFMATCHATHDDSMANEFLEAGAGAYVGWTLDTVFWTNSMTSIRAFRLLSRGFSVKQVCRLVGYGGVLNFLYHSKLTYFGDGDYRIPLS